MSANGGDGTHHLMFNEQMQTGAKVAAGETVAMTMEPDTAERTVDVPAGLSPSNRKGCVEWITSAKKPETRAQRVTKSIARLERGEKSW